MSSEEDVPISQLLEKKKKAAAAAAAAAAKSAAAASAPPKKTAPVILDDDSEEDVPMATLIARKKEAAAFEAKAKEARKRKEQEAKDAKDAKAKEARKRKPEQPAAKEPAAKREKPAAPASAAKKKPAEPVHKALELKHKLAIDILRRWTYCMPAWPGEVRPLPPGFMEGHILGLYVGIEQSVFGQLQDVRPFVAGKTPSAESLLTVNASELRDWLVAGIEKQMKDAPASLRDKLRAELEHANKLKVKKIERRFTEAKQAGASTKASASQ